jgi:ElaB/YqjD/DUF883 family membrane-anchored ribosome-binding protein
MQKKINMKDFNEKINIFSDSVGEKIQQTGEYLAPKAEELKEKAKAKIQQTGEYLAPKAEELKEKAKAKIQQTGEYLAPKAEELKEKAKTTANKFTKYTIPIVCLLLLLFCILLFLGVFSNSKDLYIISIGVPTYKNHYEMDTERNQYEAENISEILKRAEGLFSEIYFETITEHGMANNSNVEKTINKVYKKAGKNDVVLIYISSHGQKYENGEYLLLLYDFDRKEIYKTSFKAKNLIKKSKIRTIVWIDACESGAAAKDLIKNNVDLLVSSNENECSYSGTFTNTLLNGLDCRADYDGNGIVSLQEITNFVVKNVYGQKALNPIKKFSDVNLVKCQD